MIDPIDEAFIVQHVARSFCLGTAAIFGQSRRHEPAMARQIAAALLMDCGGTCMEAGRCLGRHHSTVLHAGVVVQRRYAAEYAIVRDSLPVAFQRRYLGRAHWRHAVADALLPLSAPQCKAVWMYLDVDLLQVALDRPWQRLWRDWGRRLLAEHAPMGDRVVRVLDAAGEETAANLLALRIGRGELVTRPREEAV